jgi:hypothetical protein
MFKSINGLANKMKFNRIYFKEMETEKKIEKEKKR